MMSKLVQLLVLNKNGKFYHREFITFSCQLELQEIQ